mmetsp:Transcript_20421/g.33332  ORF Transcript_20421/g.33332 Transcript_20421/m.33332 type:complete len:90 (-) Transcript_20421:810-1079(-)
MDDHHLISDFNHDIFLFFILMYLCINMSITFFEMFFYLEKQDQLTAKNLLSYVTPIAQHLCIHHSPDCLSPGHIYPISLFQLVLQDQVH